MKVLLDENLPHELRLHLMPMHDVFTVAHLGWSALKNGELLSQAAAQHFDALLTMDQGIEYQQNLNNLPLAVVILRSPTNKIDDIRPLIPQILAALGSLRPRTFVIVE